MEYPKITKDQLIDAVNEVISQYTTKLTLRHEEWAFSYTIISSIIWLCISVWYGLVDSLEYNQDHLRVFAHIWLALYITFSALLISSILWGDD